MVTRLVYLFCHDIHVKEYIVFPSRVSFTYIIYRYFLFDFCCTKKTNICDISITSTPRISCYVLVNQSYYFVKWLYSMSDYELIVATCYTYTNALDIYLVGTDIFIMQEICWKYIFMPWSVNSLRPRLNRRPFADDIFKCIFLNEYEWILPRISLKFVPKVRMSAGCWENVWVLIYFSHNLCCSMCSTDWFKFGWSEGYVYKSKVSTFLNVVILIPRFYIWVLIPIYSVSFPHYFLILQNINRVMK